MASIIRLLFTMNPFRSLQKAISGLIPRFLTGLFSDSSLSASSKGGLAFIEGISGSQYTTDTNGYSLHARQYATSSYETDNRMSPANVIYPINTDEIVTAVKYAKQAKIAVAIRTGGHQYSGASSTVAPNIQLDLSNTFRGADDHQVIVNGDQTYVRTSVSWALGEFNAYLGQNQLFVPHGQCVHVHLGGHCQSGGYGQLGRSFGLLGDHIISFELVDHEGTVREVNQKNDPDFFGALLGGSPGNLGVITHFTTKVYRDQDYQGSRGLKSIHLYNPKTLERLLDQLVEMSDNDDFPGNYDFCISVLSSSFPLLDWFPEADQKLKEEHPEIFGEDGIPLWPRSIIVYAQWVPLKPTDVCDLSWFNRIKKGALHNMEGVKPMSELTADWIFRNVREFNHPYVKSTTCTNSQTLAKDGWSKWITGRLDSIIKPDGNRLWVSAQFQNFGGKNSATYKNRDNGTSFSWRDSTIVATVDCFYGANRQQSAKDWRTINIQEGIGPNGIFSKQDKRLLWGSFGDYDLDKVWDLYYDDKARYERVKKVRATQDPDGTFTPNSFAVKRS
jgi:hypothetical protein